MLHVPTGVKTLPCHNVVETPGKNITRCKNITLPHLCCNDVYQKFQNVQLLNGILFLEYLT